MTDPQDFRGAALVAALALKDPHDVCALHSLERWIGGHAVGDERFTHTGGDSLGEGVGLNRAARREEDCPFERVFQLPHVAWPQIAHERVESTLGERLPLLLPQPSEAIEEMFGEKGNVVGALP